LNRHIYSFPRILLDYSSAFLAFGFNFSS